MTLSIIIALLAVWRLARLITVDEITTGLRQRIARIKSPEWFDVAYLVTCPWCMSVWIGWPLLIGPIWYPDNRPLFMLNVALAASLVAGMGQTIEDRLDR